MLRFLLLAAFLVVSLGMSVKASNTVVILDPGHGGRDRGTMWGGIAEKILTLSIAKKVEQNLKARGISTAMTRRTDIYRSLESRAAMPNGYRQSVFVSIHCNADPQFEARGIETFYSGAQGWRLASSIHGLLGSRTTTPDRGLKFSSFAVLRRTCCPAALVECGFLTSPGERRLLTTPVYQERVARAIAEGIARSVNH